MSSESQIDNSVSPTAVPFAKKEKLLQRITNIFHIFGSSEEENKGDNMIQSNLTQPNLKRQTKHFRQSSSIVTGEHSIMKVEDGIVPVSSQEKVSRFNRLLGHFRHHSHLQLHTLPSKPSAPVPVIVVQDCESVDIVKCSVQVKTQSPSKFWDFFGQKDENKHALPSSPQYSDGSSSELSDTDFDFIHEYLPLVQDPRDISFSSKYRFIGDYVVGKGASGTVRLGHCANDAEKKPLAIKEFRKRRKNESKQDYLRKLSFEFRVASKMNNINVIKTLDIVHDGHRWYEVMEFCKYGDLFNFIQAGGLRDLGEIDFIFWQLVQGVYYLHCQGIVHRDLKPENLLLDEHGTLKIADFGVSQCIKHSTEGNNCPNGYCRGVCGSSPYIAPEEYLGIPYDGCKVDIWALGIIYYAMIFHGVPWECATSKDSNYCHYIACRSKFEPFFRLQSGARHLLQRILEPDPEKRITLDEIMTDSWYTSIEKVSITL